MGEFTDMGAGETFRRIAYAVEWTAERVDGLRWAARLARAHHAELLLLLVVPPPTPLFETESPAKAEAELALALLLEKLETLGLTSKAFLLTGTGSVDRQIARAADSARVDLIVIEEPRQSWLGRLLAGRLAARVIARAHCPVLVIPRDAKRSAWTRIVLATEKEHHHPN
ncbi:MAG TPA: universal stress protein [Candidatus Binatia bacterium]|nr:universal stress protein [Candidatus Binatia bacterium]